MTAIALTLLSSLLFTGGYALSKTAVAEYGLSPVQFTFFRCALSLLAGAVMAAWPHSRFTWRRLLFPTRPWEQRLAAFTVLLSIFLSVFAYGVMPVTDASALGFTAPLLLTALAGLVLRERVGWRRWLAAIIGFAGMLCIVRPTGDAAALGIAAALGSALAYAIYQILVARLRAVATTTDNIMQVAIVGAVLLIVPTILLWHPLSLAAFAITTTSITVQTAGLIAIVAALRRAEASRLAPWEFASLLWAIILDAALFGLTPTLSALIGCGLILVGGTLAARH